MAQTSLVAEIDAVIPNLATGYLGDREQGFRRAAHAPIRRAAKAASPRPSSEDLLIWSRHFDKPILGQDGP